MPSKTLSAKHPTFLKSLIDQFGDSSISALQAIRQLSDAEFDEVVASLQAGAVKSGKTSKAKPKGGKKKPPNDSPVVRIASALAERGLSGRRAQEWLARALVYDGVPPDRVPQPRDDDVEAWLGELVRTVSSAVVFDIARKAPV